MRTELACPKCRTTMFTFGEVEGGKQVFKCSHCNHLIAPWRKVAFPPEIQLTPRKE